MKLTKKQENSLMQVYEAYWAEYLNGNVEAMVPLLDDSYTQVGSAESEVFSTKKEAVQFLRDTIDEVAGKLEMRNRITKLEQQDGIVLVHERCDLYALTGKEWVFYSRFRATSLLQEKKTGWKITHQHSSFPDTKTEKGQNVAIDKIAEENRELREAVKRRTAELEHKNRKLEIEASLERIRARTMAMHNTEDIAATVTTFFNEIRGLGLGSTTRSGIGILSQSEKMELWTASVKEKSQVVLHAGLLDMTIHPLLQGVKKAWQAGAPNFTYELRGEDKLTYFRAINKAPEYPIKIDLKKLPETVYHCSFPFKDGTLFVFSNELLRDDIQDIFKRFAAVFGQTYTRYLDLHKAEAQAREAQIEAALERVRARAMAMHSSEELNDVLSVLFDQFDILGINPVWAHLSLIDLKNNTFTYRMTGRSGKRSLTKQVIDLNAREEWKESLENFKKGKPNSVSCVEYRPEALPQIWELFHETLSALPEEGKVFLEDFPDGLFNAQGYCKFGYIGFNHNRKATEEEKSIVARFATEFGRIYQRYLDIEKAEAQAREAHIEASLERIRARSMAMHKSEELVEVATVLYNELINLQVSEFSDASIVIFDESNNQQIVWGARTESEFLEKSTMPLLGDKILQELYDNWHSGEPFFTLRVGHLALKDHNDFVFPIADRTEKEDRVLKNMPDPTFFNCAVFSIGYIELVADQELKEESKSLLIRFAKVFDQTFTRFLDLQKAEAQAREAQIEASLERIRARSMAMHSSEELNDVLRVMFQQIEVLGIDAKCAHLTLMDLENNAFSFRITGKNGAANIGEQIIDLDAMPIWKETVAKWKKAKPHSHQCLVYPPETLPDLWKLIATSLKSLPVKERIKISDFPNGVFDCEGHNKFGYIGFNNSRPPTDEEINIVIRFAREFERVYQRFLDIEKAEAQAREARIEAALEKVRSQSLAMHTTSEMQLVANAIFDQLRELGLEMDAVGMSGLIEAGKDYDVWIGGAPMGKALRIPYNEDTKVQRDYNKAIKLRHELFAKTYSGKRKEEYINHLLTHGEFPKALKKKMVTSTAFSTSIAFAKNSGIQIARYTSEPYTAEENELLKRFARVFEQAYIRFLDIEKAEVQAREAQIEMALEKVRSRTMAMHQSEELGEVASVMFEQISELTNTPDRFNIGITNEADASIDIWVTDQNGQVVNQLFVARADKSPVISAFFNARKTKKTLAMDLHGKALKEWVQYMNKEVGIPFKEEQLKEHRYINSVFFSHGFIGVTTNEPLAQETVALIGRFARVFQQTYVRFLDLQKAESQAREARIEAALERVRARSMAMHSTEEILEVVVVLFNQLQELNIDFIQAWISIWHLDQGKLEMWMSPIEGFGDRPIHHERPSAPFEDSTIKTWKKGDRFSYLSLIGGETITDFLLDMDRMLGNDYFERLQKKNNYQRLEFVDANHKYGTVSMSWHEGIPEQDKEILHRFAKVFEQTYTRFLDIQKAEAQAREAHIQLALERVRARSMAMQSSDELSDVLSVLFKQFDELGILPVNVWLSLFNIEENTFTYRATGTGGSRVQRQQVIDMGAMDIWKQTLEHWQRGKPESILVTLYPPDIFPQMMEIFKETFDAMPEEERISPDSFPNGLYNVQGYCKFGYIGFNHNRPPSEEEENILRKFTTEFERVYQRFLDIEKAEAQARESQIQLSLERVRARSLAMQSSDELHDVLAVLFQQFDKLGIQPVNVFLSLFDREARTLTYRASGKSGTRIPAQQVVQVDSMEPLKAIYDKWIHDNSDKVEVIYYPKEVLPELFGIFADTFASMPEEDRMGPDDFPDGGYSMAGYTPFGYLGYDHQRKATEEEKDILSRFCTEFTRVYQRFLDLQRSEAQAREAQIEAALEKVRSRSLAMQKPEELQEVVTVVGEKLQELGVILDSGGVVICTYYPDSKDVMHWTATFDTTHPSVPYYLPYFDSPIWIETWASKWESEDDFFEKVFSYEDKNHFFLHAFEHSDYKKLPEEYKKELLAVENHALSFAWQANSALMIPSHNGKLLPEEHKTILKRFARVFEQAYIRFMDLQRAEEQARESKIEMALEKVRSRTMAMHQSGELGEVASVMFEQISALTNTPDRFTIAITNEEDESFDIWVTDQNGHEVNRLFVARADESPVVSAFFKARNSKKSLALDLHGKELKEWIQYMSKEVGIPFKDEQLKEHRYINSVFFSHGFIGISTYAPLGEEIFALIGRFATVFQQTYVRFLDLQKAEAQARESQIEVAMERVRSRAMAMHHTDELTEVLGVLFEQFDFLGINPVLTHLTLMDEENETFTLRITRGGKDSTIAEQRIDINAVESWKQSFENWKKSELNAIDCIDYSPDILPYVWELMDEVMSALPEDQKIYPSDFPDGLYTTQGHCKYGYIGFNHTRRATEEEKEIVVRFAKEFGRLYQRFLDIQKAELQAREAQIEGALERVRSKTMAMHNSEDLEDIVITLFDEVLNLGLDKSIRCGIGILEGHEGMETRSVNSTSDGSLELRVGMLNMTIHPMLVGLKKAWKNGRKGYSYEFTAKDVRTYYEALNNQNEYPFNADLEKLPEQEFHRSFFFSSGILFAFSVAPISDESSKILERFAAVFGQTYRRFLDLKKAEAQAREAQIEAALERVRAKTMAMHNTDDIADTVVTFFEELVGLGLDDTMRVGIGILSQSEEMKFWTASVPGTSETILHRGMLDMTGHPLLVGAKKAWARGDSHFTYILQGRDVRDYFKVLNDAPDFPSEFNLEKLAETVYHRSYAFGDGLLYTFTETEVPEDIFSILERFAAVFGQTYTRYLDLQKAEERAREAQIEASLERIRARAMAMQESEELTQVLTVIFEQLKVLGVETVWAHLTLIDLENNEFTYRMTGRNGERILAEQKVALDASKFWAHIVESYTSTNPDLITRFEVPPESLGDIWQLFDDIFSKLPEGEKVSTEEFPEGLYTTQAYCKFGYIGINYIRRSTDEEANILLRFANEFTRAYQRFLDLQLAEERAKDAVKQASLDRVRGQIASMRSTQDLERITPLVWNELTTLGIPFIRCGVFIMDEPSEKVQVYLSAPDGHSLGVMQLPFNADKLTAESVVHWQKGKVYKAHWNKVQFNEFMQTMVDLGQIKNKKVYQGAAQPPESLYLHFVPFTQGMLYVGSEASLFEEQIELVQSLADAFAIAYARYEDFNKLEKAKERVEATLNALKATQNQLVQSEKMASLGELTAGIAHEIQNPLNFVNNFSEVSVELIEEMQEEVKKGDLEEAMAIMEDIKQNLDKINHHGKRADGIVKGMLQHSRASSGEKNPTDINVLADEYLRLAYHGLRAKDKSFNATLETHFDESIGKVNIMGQDMGRVILNLITNAFYAVKERKSQQPEGFEPTVTVTTRKEGNKVAVAVKDNGNGIPEAIKEKIFQPFFTTKPTGQGTGLGLSMSYDIITKGHGGELKVESKEGQGTTFTIVIPVK